MRIRFDEQLEQLNEEMINMGNMIEASIGNAVKALMKQDEELAKKTMAGDEKIDRTERKIEDLCLRLLLQQQPVARDLRNISAALKMVTDMERIGDHATDISELAIVLSEKTYVKKLDHIEEMARETMVMLIQSLEAYVEKDLDKAQKVIAHDDVIDDLLLIIIIFLRNQNILCTVGNTAPKCNVSRISSHNFNNTAALMRSRSISYLINCLHGSIDCSIKTNGILGTRNIQVNGSRHTNGVNAESCKFLGTCIGTVTANNNQSINTMFSADFRTFLLSFFRAEF